MAYAKPLGDANCGNNGPMSLPSPSASPPAPTFAVSLRAAYGVTKTMVILAPLIAWVPVAALAGILIVTGFRMIDRHSLEFFYTPATRLDFLVILSVILVAIFGNLIAASGVGVALAILLFNRSIGELLTVCTPNNSFRLIRFC